jgi:nondiscriminating aspartyl-tRNA synthetase
MRTSISELKTKIGETVTIAGFVHAIRNQGKIAFMRLRDESGTVQVVSGTWNADVFAVIKDLSLESVVEIEGLVKESKQVPEGFEIDGSKATVLSVSEAQLPIPVVTEKGADDVDVTNRFDWRWLDLRKPESHKIFKVWTVLEQGVREYFAKENFTQLYSPAFMSAASESGAEVFEVKYFETKAYLAQSPQFYKQMAMASGFEKIFMMGPVFRAELSFTTRHMTEFTGWDFEFAYIKSHHDIMDREEAMLKSGFKKLKEAGLIEDEIKVPMVRISLADAKEKFKAAGITSEKAGDLSPDEERGICKIVKDETGSDFVFVTDYPPATRAFYHMRDEATGLTKSFDLLYKGVEITTGAQREHRPEILIKQAEEKGLTKESLADYLNFFRFGCPPHGGVGIGPGRIVAQILDLASVKEATYLPRDVKRLRP